MEILMFLLWGLGGLLSFVGGLWLLILAFRQSVLWGLAVMIIPFASLFFIVKFWAEARHPFFVSLVSIVLMVVGAFVGVMTASPSGAAAPSGTPVAGFEPSSEPFGGGDPLDSREPTRAQDPGAPGPGGAEPADRNVESLLAEIDGRETDGDSATASAGTRSTGPDRSEEPGAEAGSPAPEAGPATGNRYGRRESDSRTDSRTTPRRSPVPRSARLPRRDDRRIPPEELSRHVGKRLEVDMSDGDRLKGVLKGVEEDQIRLLVSLSGGSMTLRLPVERIEEIRRLR